MTNVTVTADFAHPAARLWQEIADFCGADRWLPGISQIEAEKDGKRRRIILPDGNIVVEDEVARDAAAMALTYVVVEAPMPFTDYRSTMSVQPTAEGCTVTWAATLTPTAPEDRVIRLVTSLYRGGLNGLAAYLATQHA